MSALVPRHRSADVSRAQLSPLRVAITNIFATALGEAAETNRNNGNVPALLDLSSVRDAIYRFVHDEVAGHIQQVNEQMAVSRVLPPELFGTILWQGQFTLNDRINISRVCKSWLHLSRQNTVPVAIPESINGLDAGQLRKMGRGLARLGHPPIVCLRFDTLDLPLPRQSDVLAIFVAHHLAQVEMLSCTVANADASSAPRRALARAVETPAPLLARFELVLCSPLEVSAFGSPVRWFNDHAPKLNTLVLTGVAIYSRAFKAVRFLSFQFKSHISRPEHLRVVLTEFPAVETISLFGTMTDESIMTGLLVVPSTVRALHFLMRADTAILDVVQYESVPIVRVSFDGTGLGNHLRLTDTARSRFTSSPPVKLNLHFSSSSLLNVQVVDSEGCMREYVCVPVAECLTWPIFAHVRAAALIAPKDLAGRHSLAFLAMPDLEELAIVVAPPGRCTLALGIPVICPQLRCLEVMFDTLPDDVPVQPLDILPLYLRMFTPTHKRHPPELRLPRREASDECIERLHKHFSSVHFGLALPPVILPECTFS